MTTRHVTAAEFGQMLAMLERARQLLRDSQDKRKHRTLAERVAIMRQAKALKDEAMRIGT